MIKSAKLMVHHGKLWNDYNAVIECTDGRKFAYMMEYDKDVWNGVEDYLDNARYDFKNEDPENSEPDMFDLVEDGYYEEM